MTKQRKTTLIVGAVVGSFFLISAVAFTLLFRSVMASGVTAGPDRMFGAQHLKTVVALVELHRVRYGSYPARLSDLRFVGDWDEIALGNVSYIASPDRQHYYLEVERGWIGKPTLDLPAEFWQGTGYDPTLRPVGR